MAGDAVEECCFLGCGRPGHARRDGVLLCKTHYEQARTGRPLKPIKAKAKAGQYTGCRFDDPQCDRPHSSDGYCSTHYQQKNDGKPLTRIRGWRSQAEWGPLCRYGTCRSDPYSRGLCIVHYGRGISQFARDAILALQSGRCLCGVVDPGPEGWELDHAHDCTAGHRPMNYCVACVRGLLCVPCNRRAIAWYEGAWMRQDGNEPIPVLEEWVTRRIRFHGEPDSADVKVSYMPPTSVRERTPELALYTAENG